MLKRQALANHRLNVPFLRLVDELAEYTQTPCHEFSVFWVEEFIDLYHQELAPEKIFVIGNFHSGLFVSQFERSSMLKLYTYPGHWSSIVSSLILQWVLEYALAHSAIVNSAEYRPLPPSNDFHVLDELSNFEAWLESIYNP